MMTYPEPGRSYFAPFKRNKRFVAPELVSKEFKRCMVSVSICCCYDALISYLHQNKALPIQDGGEHWLSNDQIAGIGPVLLVFVALMAWGDTHFYVVHRSLHESPFLYRHVHKIHHESYNPDCWSGLSFHPVEGVLYFSGLLLCTVLPIPYYVFFGQKLGVLLFPANGHLGYELPLDSDLAKEVLGSLHHYIHHTKFNYNYGSPSPFWDIVCGTEFIPPKGTKTGPGGNKLDQGGLDFDPREEAAKRQAREAGHEFSTDSQEAVEG